MIACQLVFKTLPLKEVTLASVHLHPAITWPWVLSRSQETQTEDYPIKNKESVGGSSAAGRGAGTCFP